MADPEEVATDYTAQAHGRVILQYKEAAKLLAFIDALVGPIQEIEDAAVTIPPLDDVDVATGVNLDVTGDLVAQGRELLNGDVVADGPYRILIKARISRNNSHATGADILAILTLIFGITGIVLIDYGSMHIAYFIPRTPTPDEIAVLNGGLGGTILARPMGVRVDQFFFDPTDYFGWQEDPAALGFQEIGDSANPGGAFIESF